MLCCYSPHWGCSISWGWFWWAGKHWEGAIAEAVVSLTSLLPVSWARLELCWSPPAPTHVWAHTHTQSPSQQCSRTSSRWLSRTMVCDESSLSWDDIETSEGDESVAAVAVGLLFCSWDSCGRNNCCPCFPPAQKELSRAGRDCSRFPFLSHPSSSVGFLAKWLSIPLAWEQELKRAAPDSA